MAPAYKGALPRPFKKKKGNTPCCRVLHKTCGDRLGFSQLHFLGNLLGTSIHASIQ